MQGDDTSDEVTQADIDAGIAGSVTFPSQLLVVNVANPGRSSAKRTHENSK